MTEFEVSLRAFQHITVEADDEEEAVEKAKDKATGVGLGSWEVSEAEPHRLDR